VRKAFFALLFANLAYFAWAHWVDVPKPPPVNDAMEKLPRLKLVDELPPSQRPPANAVTQKTTLNDAAACLSVGPFADLDNSARAAALLRAKGFDPKQRAEEGQMSEGYWVYVAGMKNQAEADHALVTLERNGIKDALVMPETADAGRRLSLGLYSERARAERRAQAVRQMGLKAEVAEHKLPGTVYWVDLAPMPGMNTVPLQDLFAEGVSSRISVQPCPTAAHPTPPTGTATTTPQPSAHKAATASNASTQAAAGRKLR
jgi:hypothetical protein